MIEPFTVPLFIVGLSTIFIGTLIFTDKTIPNYRHAISITLLSFGFISWIGFFSLVYCSHSEYELIKRPIHKLSAKFEDVTIEKQFVFVNNKFISLDINVIEDEINIRKYKPFRWMFIEFDAKEVR